MPNDYKDLLSMIDTRDFKTRYSQLKQTAEEFIKNAGFVNTVYCNERILAQVLLDYYTDIMRLKEFHDIKRVRTEKIFAYTIAWIVRRKPLQYVKDDDIQERDIFVNERFAAYLLINECLCCGEKQVSYEHKNDLDEYIDLLLYYFKYRECNPKVLELAIASFKMGTYVPDLTMR